MFAGRELLTVEGLARDGELHPARPGAKLKSLEPLIEVGRYRLQDIGHGHGGRRRPPLRMG